MLHRFLPLLVIASLFILGLSLLTSSKQWFFLKTGQHNIYEMGFSGQYEYGVGLALYEDETFIVPPEVIDSSNLASILGESADSSKRIEIDLSQQKLYAYDGTSLVYDFTISTGKPWWATPTGEFRTWIKLRYTRMEGGSKALGTYYDLPNVPHVMYFSNSEVPGWRGYGIHGAYWHNNFGNTMSHGCVNLQLGDAGEIFNWAGVGTKVIIYGQTPTS